MVMVIYEGLIIAHLVSIKIIPRLHAKHFYER